jgi:hypothetical protein
VNTRGDRSHAVIETETLLGGQHAKTEHWLAADRVQASDLQARGEGALPRASKLRRLSDQRLHARG